MASGDMRHTLQEFELANDDALRHWSISIWRRWGRGATNGVV